LIHKKSRRIHYAWVVLGVTFVGLISTASVRSVSGIIIQPLEQEFGWGREQITLAISINMLLFGLAGPFLGRLTDRFGPRIIAIAAMSLISLGVAGTLWMTQAWHFYLLWGCVVGFGSAGTSMVLASSIVNRWFLQRRGLALGILGAAMSAGQLIFTQLIMYLNTDFGWRAATLFAAVVIGCVALPLILLLLVDNPIQKRLKAYGETDLLTLPIRPSSHPMQIPLHSAGFWLLALSFGICGLTTSGLIQTHLIPHGLEHGFSEKTMALSLGVMGAADIIGTVASGWICDRFGALRPLAVYYWLRGASLFLLPYISSKDSLMIFSVFYGFNWLSTVPATSTLAANMFGKQNVGVVFGWIFFAHQLGAAIAAYGASFLHSLAGDYAITFTAAGALAALSTGLVLCIRPDEPNNYAQSEGQSNNVKV
jgi:MFS family permease